MEPSHHIAYLYNFADQPWKTQKLIPEIIKAQYNNSPAGLIGNEDCGQMSAWYVFSALGFYPVNPADGKFIFGSPSFEKAILKLGNKQLVIHTKNVSFTNRYIKQVTLNGVKLETGYITYDQIKNGGNLVFTMSASPSVH